MISLTNKLSKLIVILLTFFSSLSYANQCKKYFPSYIQKHYTQHERSAAIVISKKSIIGQLAGHKISQLIINKFILGLANGYFLPIRARLEINSPELRADQGKNVDAVLDLKVGNPILEQTDHSLIGVIDINSSVYVDTRLVEREKKSDDDISDDILNKLQDELPTDQDMMAVIKLSLVNRILNRALNFRGKTINLKIGEYEYKIAGPLQLSTWTDPTNNPTGQKFKIKTKVLVDQDSTHKFAPTGIIYKKGDFIALEAEIIGEFVISADNKVSIQVDSIDRNNFRVDTSVQRNFWGLNEWITRLFVDPIVQIEINRINQKINEQNLILNNLADLPTHIPVPLLSKIKLGINRIFIDPSGLIKVLMNFTHSPQAETQAE